MSDEFELEPFDDTQPQAQPTVVPPEALAEPVLAALLEEYASRDGTDYGDQERSLEQKVSDLRGQLDREEIVIVFDPDSESVNLMTSRELAAATR